MGEMTKEEIKAGLALRKMAYEQGKVIGRRDAIIEAIELAEDAFGNGESDQLAMRLREMLDEHTSHDQRDRVVNRWIHLHPPTTVP